MCIMIREGSKMRILNFNIRLGGAKRTPQILNYLTSNDFDLIILTEFIKNKNGEDIINCLSNQGYFIQISNENGGYGSFIASKHDFLTISIEDRWAGVYIPKMDLYVLGVYVQDEPGARKNSFWTKILKYAAEYSHENVLITGDFNSCTKEDSSNGTEYYAAELNKLERIGYNDLWNCYSNDKSNRYTWFYHSGEGFRLDYAFVSLQLDQRLNEVKVWHESEVRENKVSDHSPLCIDCKLIL